MMNDLLTWAGRAAIAGLLALGAPAAAETTELRVLSTGDDSRAWDGVGRLNIGDEAFCTGALITERLVLTAAHCVYDKYNREILQPEGLRFMAGWRGGRAAADRAVRRVIPHPDYDPMSDLVGEIRHDVALVELDFPIRNGRVTTFDIYGELEPGREIGVVSYAHDRSEHPSVQEVCEVLGGSDGFLIMSCDADFGTSGAPVFVMQDGRPAIVSVVSAKAKVNGENVSLGSEVSQPLDELLAIVQGSDGVFHRVRPVTRTQTRLDGGEGVSGGAKFLRP